MTSKSSMESGSDDSEDISPGVFLDAILTTIVIDDDEKQYHVHRSLLCKKIGYFAAAYRTHIKEAIEHKFYLKDVSDSPFRTLVSWLHTEKVFLNPGSESEISLVSALQLEMGGGSDGFPEPLNEPDYDAFSETHPDRDYGYSEGSETEDILQTLPVVSQQSGQGNIIDSSPLGEGEGEGTGLTAQQSEGKIVHRLFREADPADLDSFQIESLSPISGGDNEAAPSVAKWRSLLEAKKREIEESALDDENERRYTEGNHFGRLLDVYILTDRFDIPILRREILNFIDAEKDQNRTILSGQALPSYAFVTKAYENLQTGSNLLLWLIKAFAHRWTPVEETPEDKEARGEWPREFLFDLASTCGAHFERLINHCHVDSLPGEVSSDRRDEVANRLIERSFVENLNHCSS